jgi:hypothetical protein
MPETRSLPDGFVPAIEREERLWLPGLPHAVAALSTIAVFGSAACLGGLLLAALASFVVYLPLTALWLNGGKAIAPDAPVPSLTARAQDALLGLWTATAWAGAWLMAGAG